MTIEEFRATASPVDDRIWDTLQREDVVPAGVPREAFTMYDGEYVLHEADGKYWPHAWWYAPVPKDSLTEAEEVLYEWRKEWI